MRIVRLCWTAWAVAEESEMAYDSQDCSSSHSFALYLQNPDESVGMANPGGESG